MRVTTSMHRIWHTVEPRLQLVAFETWQLIKRRHVSYALLAVAATAGSVGAYELVSAHPASHQLQTHIQTMSINPDQHSEAADNSKLHAVTEHNSQNSLGTDSVSNSNKTDINISTSSSGSTTTGSVTVNGKTTPLPATGSIHEEIGDGNTSISISQSSVSSSSGDSSQHLQVRSRSYTNIDTESD